MHQYPILLLTLVIVACSSKPEGSSTLPVGSSYPISVGNSVEGKTLYATCAVCHGASGEGNQKMNAPALASTESWYLYQQLMNFKKEIRGATAQDSLGFQMAAMAKTLKDSIAISHVIAYIKTMPAVTLPSLVLGDIEKGKRIYESVCGSCHGPGASGNEKLNAPKLNGLNDWYLKRQVYNFKNSIRGAHPRDKFGAQMIPMMALLPDSHAVNNVIAYIRSTAQPVSK